MTSNLDVLKPLLERLRTDGGRYLLSVGLTREERDAQPEPTFGGKGHVRWLTDEEYAALCSLSLPVETNGLQRDANRYRYLRERGLFDRYAVRERLADGHLPVFQTRHGEALDRELDECIGQTSPVEPARELPPAFQSLLDLQPNWDSYGSKRINLACVQKAYEIWKQLAGTWLPVPHSDGTVGLEQHHGGFDIEIDVDLSLPPENGSPVISENNNG